MPNWPWLIFISIYGACVGSFLNVVIYRVPAGKSLIYPPSACPRCNTRLAIYDNVPVLGWLWLRGKCRYCRNPISIQYPIIEAVTALLFGGLAWVYYVSGWQPGWKIHGLDETWPVLIVHLALIASLLAATIIDARLYIIPLAIPWCTTLIAAIVLPLSAWLVPGSNRVLPAANGMWVGVSAGGMLGLIIAIVLLELGVLPLSFADEEPEPTSYTPHDEADGSLPLITIPLMPLTEPNGEAPNITHPHLIREMFKEIAFVSFPLIGGILGALLWNHFAAGMFVAVPAGWRVLAGVGIGYLAGGGLIWGIRISGSLAFQKEAMGLGDVHLLAAIGAVLGWQSSTMVFFFAPFLGLSYVAISLGWSMVVHSRSRVIPYGPYLAAATLIVMVYEWSWFKL